MQQGYSDRYFAHLVLAHRVPVQAMYPSEGSRGVAGFAAVEFFAFGAISAVEWKKPVAAGALDSEVREIKLNEACSGRRLKLRFRHHRDDAVRQ